MIDDNMTVDEKERIDLIAQFNKEFPNHDIYLDDEKVFLMIIINQIRFMESLEKTKLQEAIDALNDFLKTTIVEYDVERKTFYKGERAIFSMKKNGKLVQRNYQLPPSVMKKICEFYESEGSK